MRVLVVEDETAVAELIVRRLTEFGFTAAHVPTLMEATQVVGQYDRVLLDLNLPDSLGLATLQSALKWQPPVPILVMTGGDPDLGPEAVSLGAYAVFQKGRPLKELDALAQLRLEASKT